MLKEIIYYPFFVHILAFMICRKMLEHYYIHHEIVVSIVEPGEYIHFDLESSIIRCLMCVSSLSIVDQLEIDFNADGCALDKSGSIHIWPIQYRIANIQHTKPIVAGIYKGTQKPMILINSLRKLQILIE